MKHRMHLKEEPFEKIRLGKKSVEMRLWDEKRQKLSVGDLLELVSERDGAVLTVRVSALHRFPDFKALYAALPPDLLGYGAGEQADPADMEFYYDPDAICRYGVVGIALEKEDAP